VLDSRRSHIYTGRLSGAPVLWRALGPCYTAVSGVALASKAPHPSASMLLIDFILSKDAQKIYTDKLGYVSMRTDLATSDAPSSKLYLDMRPTFASDYERWSDLASSAFNGGL
jgi:ABC-type glycerol-3-phosphate transport system substrate-binding protein